MCQNYSSNVGSSKGWPGRGREWEGMESWQQVYASEVNILTFAPMNGHRLNPLEQEVFVNGIHISFLLCKDEHLPKKGSSSQRVSPRVPQHRSLPSSLILGTLGPA